MADSKILGNLYRLLGLRAKNNTIEPIEPGLKKLDKERNPTPKSLLPRDVLNQLIKWMEKEISSSSKDVSSRFDRYTDLLYMVYNDSTISHAVELYADESTQPDSQHDVIFVEAKNETLKKRIYEVLNSWDINKDVVRDHCYNLALFGDSLSLCTYDPSLKGGITRMVHVDPKFLRSRIETNLTKFYAKKKTKIPDDIYKMFAGKTDKDTETAAHAFENILFGFMIGDSENKSQYAPPWGAAHYRLYSSKNEFFPYGKSLFISSLAAFRHLKLSKTLMSIARVLSFPKTIFSIKVDKNMTQEDQWAAIESAREQYHSAASETATKLDEIAVESEVWVPEDLIDIDSVDPKMDLKNIGDIEFLREDVMMGTRIPRGYLIAGGRDSWGTSSVSLLQQFKPFARSCYYIQSSFLKELTRLLTIHFVMTGELDYSDSDFSFRLGMNFPLSEQEDDRVSIKSDTLDLATDVMSAIGDAIGGRNFEMPIEVVKDVLKKLTFLDDDDIDKWVTMITKSQEKKEAITEDEKEILIKRYNQMDNDSFSEVVFESLKRQKIIDQNINNTHYVTNCIESNDRSVELISKIRHAMIRREG